MRIISIAVLGIKERLLTKNAAVLALLLIVTLMKPCGELVEFADTIQADVNALPLLTYIYNNQYYRIVIQLGIVFLFSDAPFDSPNSLFVLLRCGRKRWIAGQLLYLFATSGLYTLFLQLCVIVGVARCVEFNTSWGKVFATAAQGSYMQLRIPYKLQLLYTPVQTMLYTLSLIFLLTSLLGLLMLLCSKVFFRTAGTTAASLVVLLGTAPALNTQYPELIARWSPCSLTQLMLLDSSGVSAYPSVGYAYSFLLCCIGLLAVLNIFAHTSNIITTACERMFRHGYNKITACYKELRRHKGNR